MMNFRKRNNAVLLRSFKNIPIMVLIIFPLTFAFAIAIYQLTYWANAYEIRVPLRNVNISKAAQFKPGDSRRAKTTEVTVTFVDNIGVQRIVTQLSPLTKYFFKYGDELTVRYYNDNSFTATIWNTTVKFYYLLIIIVYCAISSVFIGVVEMKNKRRSNRRRKSTWKQR